MVEKQVTFLTSQIFIPKIFSLSKKLHLLPQLQQHVTANNHFYRLFNHPLTQNSQFGQAGWRWYIWGRVRFVGHFGQIGLFPKWFFRHFRWCGNEWHRYCCCPFGFLLPIHLNSHWLHLSRDRNCLYWRQRTVLHGRCAYLCRGGLQTWLWRLTRNSEIGVLC